MKHENRKKIVVLGTGGTIAGTAQDANDNVSYTAAQLGVEKLLANIPGLAAQFQIESEQVAQLDSKDMSWAVWQALVSRSVHWLRQEDVQGVVITHGTDTLEETAFFLRQVLPASLMQAKPVVLTCAMRPATARHPDGPQNLLDAFAVASSPQACGVLVACAGSIHSADAVQKIHPYRLDAFDSGDAGALGFVEEGRVRWTLAPSDAATRSLADATLSTGRGIPMPDLLARTPHGPRVEIVMNHAGASGWMVDAMLQVNPSATNPLRGFVVAGTGNGTIHQDLEEALLRAAQAGISVVRSTRCAYGQVLDAASKFPHSSGRSPVKARVAMMLELIRSDAESSAV